MKSIGLLSLMALLFGWGAIAKGENIKFANRCSYAVEVGRTWNAPFAVIPPGGKYTRTIGADNVPRPAIAIYAYRKGHNVGRGHATLAEFTLNQANGVDYYDVSNVDAFSVPMSVRAIGMSCPVAACERDLLSSCPSGNKYTHYGVTISCTKDRYLNRPQNRDNPNHPVALLIKRECPSAYAWSGGPGTHGCKGSKDFLVTLCK